MEAINRELFPILDKKPYFNACSIGPLATPVRSAVDHYISDWDQYGGVSWVMENGWSQAVEEARSLFARIIGAKPQEIAYSFGNSTAFASVISSLPQKGNMIFNDLDFPAIPSNIMANHMVKHRVVKSTDGKVEPSDYVPLIDQETKLVTACEVASNTGSRIDTKVLVEICHEKDVPVFVDSYQATGVIPTDVKKLDLDYLAAGCLKWLIGGFGISFLYIRPDLIESTNPQSIGWMGVDNPFEDLFDKLRTNLHRPETALKFQYGTPYPFGAITAKEGMKIVDDIGVDRIYQHDMKLTQLLIDEAHQRGYQTQTPVEPSQRGSIVNIKMNNAESIVNSLQEEGYILDMRSGGIRLAPHFYNNSEDVLTFLDNLDQMT